jgi:hypothetical protein
LFKGPGATPPAPVGDVLCEICEICAICVAVRRRDDGCPDAGMENSYGTTDEDFGITPNMMLEDWWRASSGCEAL